MPKALSSRLISKQSDLLVNIDDLLVTAEGVRDSAGPQDEKGFRFPFR